MHRRQYIPDARLNRYEILKLQSAWTKFNGLLRSASQAEIRAARKALRAKSWWYLVKLWVRLLFTNFRRHRQLFGPEAA